MFAAFRELFFSFSGQVDRAAYWQRSLTIILVFIVAMKGIPLLLNLLLHLSGLANPLQEFAPTVQIGRTTIRRSWMYVLVALPLGFLLSWSLFSIAVRRLRERGRAIWLVVPLVVLPLVLHLAYWMVNLLYPFTIASGINMSIQDGSWAYAPEYLFPRALLPVWNLLELSGGRFYDVYEQAMREMYVMPAYVSAEDIASISMWRVYVCLLIPAACLSAWASIELGVLRRRPGCERIQER
ncbi:hypothetical protein DBR37_12220 [Herminiimonas sp. KBW02]|uniref:DUF805 domain-containing protein n=1 Tax=Herminiimonas sp. KBW02 TaxID=2153363 RepID=UPI000F59E4DA|nr:DUF805 domain-containing protein [Herminiimonas sp. KBW02]RQO33893.1 hypothetical protein DBR37_12220 [Herminiimonas sp. KBW02]